LEFEGTRGEGGIDSPMVELSDLFGRIPERHRLALTWFVDNRGREVPWPAPLENGTKLASKAKGIYKPEWSEYALSIRQALNSPYPDREPLARSDGTWSFFYFQENKNPEERDSEYTNRGLFACWRDSIPIGVMRQVATQPRALYKILGPAIVAGWSEGYFILEGFTPTGQSHGRGSASEVEQVMTEPEPPAPEPANLQGLADGREWILASIVRRRGQLQFRQELLDAYEARCAISGCDAPEALEAAHIIPYLGPDSNHLSNGLLLRADLHTLFDMGLISVESATMKILLSPRLTGTSYDELAGKKLRAPRSASHAPSEFALAQHRTWSGM
jgi:putative restriction endonuclease